MSRLFFLISVVLLLLLKRGESGLERSKGMLYSVSHIHCFKKKSDHLFYFFLNNCVKHKLILMIFVSEILKKVNIKSL